MAIREVQHVHDDVGIEHEAHWNVGNNEWLLLSCVSYAHRIAPNTLAMSATGPILKVDDFVVTATER